MAKKVNVLMAVYNGKKFLSEQLDSVLRQSYSDFDLIVCDDCSNDGSADILRCYAEKDSRIKVIFNENNIGFKKNFEKLSEFSDSEYVAFCDQDDIWTDTHIEKLLSIIGDKDLACGNAELINENGKSLNITTKNNANLQFIPKKKEEQFFYLMHNNFAQGTTILLKSDLLKIALPIPDDVKYHDWWLTCVAASRNGCAYTDEILLFYRQHGNNISDMSKKSRFDRIKNNMSDRTKKNSEYMERICFVKDFVERFGMNVSVANEAVGFYEHLIKKRYLALPYFFKNYSKIYLSKSFSLFLFRFFKTFFL